MTECQTEASLEECPCFNRQVMPSYTSEPTFTYPFTVYVLYSPNKNRREKVSEEKAGKNDGIETDLTVFPSRSKKCEMCFIEYDAT